jgi:hypothetical protein
MNDLRAAASRDFGRSEWWLVLVLVLVLEIWPIEDGDELAPRT